MDTEYIEQVWNIEINDSTYLSLLGLMRSNHLTFNMISEMPQTFWQTIIGFPIANV